MHYNNSCCFSMLGATAFSEQSQEMEQSVMASFDTPKMLHQEDTSDQPDLINETNVKSPEKSVICPNESSDIQILFSVMKNATKIDLSDIKSECLDSECSFYDMSQDKSQQTQGFTHENFQMEKIKQSKKRSLSETVNDQLNKKIVITIAWKCLKPGCNEMFYEKEEFDLHMAEAHKLGPNRCYLANCKRTFDRFVYYISLVYLFICLASLLS